jgi:pimeloyl-ACP methyl ester carboxylesterase
MMPYDLVASATTRRPVERHTMRPAVIGDCHGWLHESHAPSDTGIVICTGIAHDKLAAHHGFRQAAEAFAAAGYPTLRFDYPGTGDSRDADANDHWTVWEQSIAAAIDWLRERSGARRIVLVGLQIGAALAACAAQRRNDIVGLAMLEPVLRGSALVRQLQMEAHLGGARGFGEGRVLDVHGLLLPAASIEGIARVDLRGVVPPKGCAVAIFRSFDSSVLGSVAERWAAAGAAIDVCPFDGLEPLLRPTFMAHERPADFSGLLDWLRRCVPKGERAHGRTAPFAVALRGEGWTEQALRFGIGDGLSGVLCVPTDNHPTDQALIIVNGGGDPHYGHARQSVELARRLAAEGIASLRMDFAGLGESAEGSDRAWAGTHIMETDRTDDIGAAIEVLHQRDYRRIALQGLCAGAYHAFHTAIADPRIGALLLVNQPMFSWLAGDRVELIAVRSPSGHLRGLASARTWVSFLRGRSVFRPLMGSVRIRLRNWRAASRERTRQAAAAAVARRGLQILARRGVRTLFLYWSDDPGLDMFRRSLGAGETEQHGVVLRVSADIDHTLSRKPMRRKSEDEMIAFLKACWAG